MKKSRKDDVVKSANCIIRKKGYSNLSFSQIAKELSITRENVHHYFKKKEALGNSCLDVMIKDLEEYLSSVIQKDITALNKLKEYFKIYKTQQSQKEDCPIVSLLNEYELLPDSMKIQVKRLYEIELKYMYKILNDGLINKEFKIKDDVLFKAKLIITQLKGSISYSKLEDNFDEMILYILTDLKYKVE
jgi:TetR/AcrR family transcriptional repressor of nem operon